MQKHGIRGWGCFGDAGDGTLRFGVGDRGRKPPAIGDRRTKSALPNGPRLSCGAQKKE